jgi:hypothetical protein
MSIRIEPSARVFAPLVVLCATLITPGAAMTKQPAPQPTPPTPPALTPDEAFAAARLFYRSNAVTERVSIAVRVARAGQVGQAGAGVSRTSTILVRTQPDAADPAKSRVWLQAGRLRLFAADGAIALGTDRADGAWFTTSVPTPLSLAELEKILPPMPIPELELWQPLSPADGSPLRLTVYARATRWESVKPDSRAGSGSAGGGGAAPRVLEGSCTGGRVTLELDPKTSRLRAMRVTLAPPINTSVEWSFSAVNADTVPFTINTDPARKAASIEDFLGRITDQAVASRLDCAKLTDLDGRSADCTSLWPAEQSQQSRRVLVFMPMGLDPAAIRLSPDIERALGAVSERLKESPVSPPRARLALAIDTTADGGVVAPPEAGATDERVLMTVQKCVDVFGPPLRGANGPSLFTTDRRWASAYLPIGCVLAAVVLDERMFVRAVVPLMPDETGGGVDQFDAELRAALGEQASPAPAKPADLPTP